MKVDTYPVFLLLLALGWGGCQAEERTEMASLQKQVAALTRQVQETRRTLAEVQDQQQQLSSFVQQLQATRTTFEQPNALSPPAVLSEENVLEKNLSEENVAPPAAESLFQAPRVSLSPAFSDSPSALSLKTRVACNEVWNLLGQGASVAGAAKLLGATPEAVEQCEKKIGRGGSGGSEAE